MSYRVLFFSRASNPLKVPPFIPRLRGGSLLAGRDKMIAFVRQIDIRYKCFFIEKKHIPDAVVASGRLSRQISQFIMGHWDEFRSHEIIKVYYCKTSFKNLIIVMPGRPMLE